VLSVDWAPATWLDDLTGDGGVIVALPLSGGQDGVTVEDPDGIAGRLRIDVDAVLSVERPKGASGEVIDVPHGHDGVDRLLLVGMGAGTPGDLRKAGAAVARRASKGSTLIVALALGRSARDIEIFAEAAGLASYRFSRRSAPEDGPTLRSLQLVPPDAATPRSGGWASTATVMRATAVARDLANQPSLEKSPQWLAEQATALCREAGVGVRVRDERELAAEGFGGILAVGAGSARPPRLIEMTWAPRGATRHVVLIGKGITFDSGGLSLKPREAMVPMKTDMAGGAAVIATMTALRDLGVTTRVTGLVPAAENMPGAAAARPGDIIRHWGGITSEVLNTDAEGRLVLADALAYAAATVKPDVLVDIATLTGAASLGLGRRHAALYATTPGLRGELVIAGDRAGERLWPMPMVEDYRDALDSPIADLRNIGEPAKHYSGGSIIAALFLREFTGGLPWAHLDVAGPARAEADEAEVTKGATGFGVRTFLRWLQD
jgi:leucyl aminopeptidase